MTSYESFLANKMIDAPKVGFKPTLPMNPHLFEWQVKIVKWALEQGRAACWADCGLGKGIMALEWCRHVCDHTGGDALILTPLAVANQFRREGEKFGIPVTVVKVDADVRPGINVTNYQRLDGLRDIGRFSAVVCDESDILASLFGKLKRLIIDSFERTPYKLDCSATPAPNDHVELGNHAEFLGIMPPSEMLSRWFVNDADVVGHYRLKGHAAADFWRWVSSWATAVSKPSDLGYPDGDFNLPPLEIVDHCVAVDHSEGREDGFMFRMPSLSATSLHDEKRLTCEGRAKRAAEIVATKPGVPWIVWCDTDYEADALKRAMPHAVELRGSESPESKEAKLEGFIDGTIRVLITKPKIAAHGLNLQHCRDTVYVGLSYSFKYFYQSVRRFWRFGQTETVTAHVVSAETEGRIGETIRRKQADHDTMKASMVAAMAEFGLGSQGRRSLGLYEPTVPMTIPAWLTTSGGVAC